MLPVILAYLLRSSTKNITLSVRTDVQMEGQVRKSPLRLVAPGYVCIGIHPGQTCKEFMVDTLLQYFFYKFFIDYFCISLYFTCKFC